MTRPDPYRLLGLEPDASAEEVRAAFREKVREKHPDTGPPTEDGSDVQEVIEAYRMLSDPELRRRHQASGKSDSGLGGHQIHVRRTGRIPSDFTQKTGRCVTCGGSGRVREEVTCPACNGRAQITALDGDRGRVINCRRCSGTGTLVSPRVCPTCSEPDTKLGQ